jgi:hypothetical protein
MIGCDDDDSDKDGNEWVRKNNFKEFINFEFLPFRFEADLYKLSAYLTLVECDPIEFTVDSVQVRGKI